MVACFSASLQYLKTLIVFVSNTWLYAGASASLALALVFVCALLLDEPHGGSVCFGHNCFSASLHYLKTLIVLCVQSNKWLYCILVLVLALVFVCALLLDCIEH